MSITQLLFSSQGRVRRTTYWLYGLAIMGLTLLALFIDIAMDTYDSETGYGPVRLVVTLLALFPSIMVQIKRCHDRDHSGWFMLLLFIPILNLWPTIELSFFAGTNGPNQYGPDPRQPLVSQIPVA